VIVVTIVQQKSPWQSRDNIGRIYIRKNKPRIGRVETDLFDDVTDSIERKEIDNGSRHPAVQNRSPREIRSRFQEWNCGAIDVTFGPKAIRIPAGSNKWFQKQKLDIGWFPADDLLLSRFEIVPIVVSKPDDLHCTPFRC